MADGAMALAAIAAYLTSERCDVNYPIVPSYTYDSNNRLISIEDLVEGSKVSFIYEHIEVSPLLSNAAAFFSQTGLIQYYAPMPEFQH